MLLRLDNVLLAFGSRPLLDHVSLQVDERERICIVGRNGEGKSSLLKLVAGQVEPDDGTLWVQPGARLAFMAQDLEAVDDALVRQIVASGLPEAERESWEHRHRIDAVMSRLGLEPEASFSTLSGGWRRRALLGRALVMQPMILLLDEPTNHLDIAAIEWLEEFMLEYRGALLFVSHDRSFVNRLATRVVELDRGALSSWPGNYDDFVTRKSAQLANEVRANALFDKKLAQEEAWIRKGVEARRTRNEGRVRALHALRAERRQRRERLGRAEMSLLEQERSSQLVFAADAACLGYDGTPLIRDFTVRIQRGDRIGIVGPNGAGKSTLIRGLLGELQPASGIIRQGMRLQTAYYDQQREQLQLDATVADNVAEGSDFVATGAGRRHVASYLRDFLFRPDQLRTPASALSGGERNRLLLARLFARPANLLVMDEPTNDLDIDTLELLEELVAEFTGTLLLVSHDRSFLDHVVTSLLVLDGSGSVQEFVGGWSDWLAYRRQQQKSPVAPARATAQSPAGKSPAGKPRKLSFRDQRELEQLPGTIEALEAEHGALALTIQSPDFYAQPFTTTGELLEKYARLGEAIESAYARWQELSSASERA